jgi:hypothetical protein
MQEKGILKKFYKTFRDNYSEDNTGKKFLEQMFGKSLNEIDTEYVNWVKTLKYNK